MSDSTTRVARVVLVSCDAFDNFPPGLTGKTLVLTGKLAPALFGLFMQQMRLRPVRRLPIAFGWLTKRGDAATARWMKPVMRLPGIRRDAVRALRAAAADTHILEEAAEHLPGFKHPAHTCAGDLSTKDGSRSSASTRARSGSDNALAGVGRGARCVGPAVLGRARQ
jgi:hypothetical protein